jgi:RHS repeat-associated protein
VGCIKEADSSDYHATHQSNPFSSQTNQDATGDPVNVVTGAFTLSERDLAIPSQTLLIELARHYNNQLHDPDLEQHGLFGRGWTSSLELHVAQGQEPGQYIYTDDRGTKIIFLLDEASGQYVPPPGSLGMDFTCLPTGEFLLRQIDGMMAEFDRVGRISTIVRPGPLADARIEFKYDEAGALMEVSGAGGRGIRFYYQDHEPLVRSVVDHTGRCWQYRYNNSQELIQVRDPANRIRDYVYNTRDILVSTSKGQTEYRKIRAMSEVLKYKLESSASHPVTELVNQYTSDRRVYRQKDALGNVTRFDYNRFSRTTYVTDPAGWTTVYCYDAAGNTTKVRCPGGGTTEHIYDDQRNLVAEIDPCGNRTEYVTLKVPEMLNCQQEFGRRTIGNRSDYISLSSEDFSIGYDHRGNRPLVRDAIGNTTRFYDYTPFGRPRRAELADGSEIHFTYDERCGLPTHIEKELRQGRTEPLRWMQEWTYDPFGNTLQHTEWAEDLNGKCSSKQVTEWGYDPEGHHAVSMLRWIEQNGQGRAFAAEEHYEWDALGRLISTTTLRRNSVAAEAKIITTRFGYDILGRMIWSIDPEGTATCWECDLEGRISETFSVADADCASLANIPNAQRIERKLWEYDAMGRNICSISPSGSVTEREFDERGLCILVREPSGHTIKFEYDRDGNQVRQLAPTGYEVCTCYDLAGRIISQTDSLGLASSRRYNALGQLHELISGAPDNGAITHYTYDTMGRLSGIIYPDGACERLTYDERGNVIERHRGRENESFLYSEEFRYDPLGRMACVLSGKHRSTVPQLTIQYDDTLRKLTVYNALNDGLQTYYDSTENPIRKVDDEGRILLFEYDGCDRLRYRWSEDRLVESHYKYSPTGRLISAREGAACFLWEYDVTGRVNRHEQTIEGRTISFSYEYDNSDRLVRKKTNRDWWIQYHYVPGSALISGISIPDATIAIKTDSCGRVKEESWGNAGRTCFEYQTDGLLTGIESFDGPGGLLYRQHLVRDARNRPVEEVRQIRDHLDLYRYSYDALDRLESVICKHGERTGELRRYVHDEQGNRLQECHHDSPCLSYRYDQANRLIEVNENHLKNETYEYDRSGNLIRKGKYLFTYDAARRMRRVFENGDPTPLVEYHYAATGERVQIVRPNGTERVFYDNFQEILSESSAGVRTMFWSPRSVDTPLAAHATGQLSQRICTDWLGSVVSVGTTVAFREYDPFGYPLNDVAASLPFGYCGKRFDHETGFYYNRARFYDPSSGRFTQPDSKGIIDGTNPYLYCRCNPTTYLDPTGFISVKGSRGSILSAYNNIMSPYPELEALRGLKIEHFNVRGRKTGTSYFKGPEPILFGLLGKTDPRLEHFDVKGERTGRTYFKGPEPILFGLLGKTDPRLEHFDVKGERTGATHFKGPEPILFGLLGRTDPYFEHFDVTGARAGTTHFKGPEPILFGLLGKTDPYFEHFDVTGARAGRSYIGFV